MSAGRRATIYLASALRSQYENISSTGLRTLRVPQVRVAGVHGSSGEGSTSGDTSLASKGPYSSKLKTRRVISFDGPDVIDFLQGLVTNDVSKLVREPSGETPTPSPNAPLVYQPPLYAAMLNSQGRFLYDLFLYKPSAGAEKLDRSGSGPGKSKDTPELLADVDAGLVDEIIGYLKKHILRKKIEVKDVSKDFSVWQHYGGTLAEKPDNTTESEAGAIGWGGTKDESALRSSETSGDEWLWYKDPRLSTLGLRGVFSTSALPPLVEAGTKVEEDYYLLWRMEQGVAEGSTEIPKGEAIPLEYNLAGLNAIDFNKGCYVGQELVARTHHRGVIRKRVMPLNFVQANGEEAQDAVTPGADVVDKKAGKKVGKVTTVLGPRGLGLIRLASASDGSELCIENQEDIHVKAVRPKWWFSEWGHEDEGQAASNA
ncbi:putative transferase At4g12130, mitochondrial isoform X1 [Physcomitrium patens]|uniref:CAF17 C-terminal domain-containing protein n=1 Tax=Physcomitrium patens TaxID=3218 RepID=A9SJE6_PHYPA|nr:putative transferase At4g12130, mitochondrial isoform X1 [Physcomitrium patens]PNR59722.1 hypothetical protein PHYPA_002514 [Physcomitrium patens]|eukprot:XP_024399197.1 putative transferase At4g12130, mitochondrial isoform X1 [Physcomitrella patens]